MLALALGVIAVFFILRLPRPADPLLDDRRSALGWALSVLAGFGPVTNIVLGPSSWLSPQRLNVPALRRKLLSDHILALYRRILPDMSQTEKEAIDAGTVWWDADLFSGKPDWNKLLATPAPRLSAEEQAFLDGPVEQLCEMCNDWEITHERQDLPEHVWQFIKDKGFLGMIIPKQYGGLGFSALAHSAVVMKLSTRSSTAAISVMVPNSLGRASSCCITAPSSRRTTTCRGLAKGQEVPCFRAHQPGSGSDAASIPGLRRGVQRALAGTRIARHARHLGQALYHARPGGDALGLAFRLYDPENLLAKRKISALPARSVPTNTPGRQHRPPPPAAQRRVPERPELGQGRVHAARLDHRRQDYAGKGWMMLMGCLAAAARSRCPPRRSAASRRSRASPAPMRAYAASSRRRSASSRAWRSARPHRRALLHDGRDARDDRRRGRPRREAAVLSAIAKYHMTERARDA
jgi:acyl-CoA dehydrogenase